MKPIRPATFIAIVVVAIMAYLGVLTLWTRFMMVSFQTINAPLPTPAVMPTINTTDYQALFSQSP